MSSKNAEDSQKQEHVKDTGKDQVNEDSPENDPMHEDGKEEHLMPSPQQEEEVLKKKYEGILPKKTHLKSKVTIYLCKLLEKKIQMMHQRILKMGRGRRHFYA
ncbi:hypothetical protein MKX03_030508, partial [Papaver bracteatum]